MKRSFSNEINEENQNNKVVLVERNVEPNGIPLVNALRVSKHTYEETMQLSDAHNSAESFIQANALNKLDVIGKQMRNLQSLMANVISESKLNNELHNAACNFVKKPGQVYHLYERPSGQKYFSMLSPQEWVNTPHLFIGSFRLEADQSWTKAGEENNKYEGINFLTNVLKIPQIQALMDTS
ncbi:uncharacterized protein C1orf50 homolog [Aethina tumida]|uniref:uncharacterized protein C1orf50 homolog n=1 Tax=Aethina tumida TaxID=116153 RepID=UPI0021476BE8|nr:uncharacterized protein C1orf50 homolog [Aethina tumida]